MSSRKIVAGRIRLVVRNDGRETHYMELLRTDRPLAGLRTRDGWLRIVFGVFFGIVAPGLLLFAIVATVRLIRDKKKQSGG